MSCAEPIAFDALVAYWAHEDADDAGVEEHVFACDACAARLAAVARIAQGVARVSGRRGGVDMVVTGAIVDRLAREGLKLRSYRVAPGGTVACTVAPDDDLVVTTLDVDLAGVESVDLVKRRDGAVFSRMSDVPVDAARGEIVYTVSGDRLRGLPKTTIEVEVIAKAPGGPRRLGLYVFDHSPWPGAGDGE
jgi:hypothetical protein